MGVSLELRLRFEVTIASRLEVQNSNTFDLALVYKFVNMLFIVSLAGKVVL
jgi:hypothetical protein